MYLNNCSTTAENTRFVTSRFRFKLRARATLRNYGNRELAGKSTSKLTVMTTMTLTFDASALKVEQTFGQILLFQRLCSQKPINPYGATIMQTLLSSEPAQAIALHSDISSFAFDPGHGLEHSKKLLPASIHHQGGFILTPTRRILILIHKISFSSHK